jgi:hypothetical protein
LGIRSPRLRRSALLAAAVILAGCTGNGYAVLIDPQAKADQSGSLVSLGGHVLAPAGIVATGGGNIVGAGGGNIVATGGGNIVATGGGNIVGAGGGNLLTRQLMDVADVPLKGAEVFLADPAGIPLKNSPHGFTANDGSYRLDNVPSGFTYIVAVKAQDAKGRAVTMQALAYTPKVGATADVSLASTCVTIDAVEGRSALGDIEPFGYLAARDALAAKLAASTAPDPSDRKTMLAWMHDAEASSREVRAAQERLRQQLTAPPVIAVDPVTLFVGQVGSPSPVAPTPTTLQSSSPTPAPTALAGPSASPSPSPTQAPLPSASPTAGATPTSAPTPTPTATTTTNPSASPTPVGLPTRPPRAATLPGELPRNPVGGQLLTAAGLPLANISLTFKPRGNHHEVYAPMVTDERGVFQNQLQFSTLPDSYELSSGDLDLGIWSLSQNATQPDFPRGSFSPLKTDYRILVLY